MLSETILRKIKELEETGIDVVVIENDGKLDYSTQGKCGNEYCDQCSAFRLLPDSDSDDWFKVFDMKAVCLEVNGVIEDSLKRTSEWINIRKPIYCPKLDYELSEEEKKEAVKSLKYARERMK
jgi:hypothetical protein